MLISLLLATSAFQEVEPQAIIGGNPAGCGALINRDPYPRFQVSHVMGYDSAGSYYKTGMLLPEPIPIGIRGDDTDKILLRCGLGSRGPLPTDASPS